MHWHRTEKCFIVEISSGSTENIYIGEMPAHNALDQCPHLMIHQQMVNMIVRITSFHSIVIKILKNDFHRSMNFHLTLSSTNLNM